MFFLFPSKQFKNLRDWIIGVKLVFLTDTCRIDFGYKNYDNYTFVYSIGNRLTHAIIYLLVYHTTTTESFCLLNPQEFLHILV